MNNFIIQFGRGRMLIYLDKFFPCSIARLKKLLKTINLDWENRNELLERLNIYFQEQIDECKSRFKQYGREWSDAKQLVSDTNRLVESRKRPIGTFLTTDELKQAKKDLKEYKEQEKTLLSRAKEMKRNIESFQKLIQFLQDDS